jgi:hypothetical protein
MSFPPTTRKTPSSLFPRIILDTLEGLNMTYPKTSLERHQELLSMREQLKK